MVKLSQARNAVLLLSKNSMTSTEHVSLLSYSYLRSGLYIVYLGIAQYCACACGLLGTGSYNYYDQRLQCMHTILLYTHTYDLRAHT